MKINNNEVHIWYAYDEEIRDEDLLVKYHALLNEAESIQQKRFYFEKHRHQYLITRSLVRSVLSLYVETIPPQAWEFRKNKYDKPYISNAALPFPLSFNISHTDKMVVLAVTLENEIGVDVEYTLRRNTGLDIAEKFFSGSEFSALKALPVEQQRGRFFDLWTLKEAYIKACGMGLSIPLDHFSYSFSQPGNIEISFDVKRDDDPQYWRFWQVQPNDTHVVSMAIHNIPAAQAYHLSMRKIVPLSGIQEVNYPVVAQSRL